MEAELGEGESVSAESGRGVEDLSGWLHAGERRGRLGLGRRVALAQIGGIRRQVDLVEHLVPDLVRRDVGH